MAQPQYWVTLTQQKHYLNSWTSSTLFQIPSVLNSSKTEGMRKGSLKGSKKEPFGIKWPKIPIKALGLYFIYDRKLLKEKNFIERLDIKKTYNNIWSSRGVSVYGKVTIIKSLLIPKFV